MRAVWVLVVGGVALASPPSLLWEGKLIWPISGEPSLNSTLTLSTSWAGWEWKGKAEIAEGAWKSLELSGVGRIGPSELSPTLSLDPQTPKFRGLSLPWKLDLHALRVEGVVRLEEKGFGWGLTLVGPRDAFWERMRFRFNLKRFLDEVLENTFTPSFSFGEVRFQARLPCCVARVRGWLVFTKKGFSELGVSFPLPLPRETGLSLSGIVRFSLDRKAVYLSPAFFYELPPCVVAFLGLDWDQTTWTIRGIKAYALGFRCALGKLEVRGLTMLEDIGLIRQPYREVLEISWKEEGCCGPTQAWITLYFGETGLFGIGEVEAAVELALGPAFSLLLGMRAQAAGPAELRLEWKAAL